LSSYSTGQKAAVKTPGPVWVPTTIETEEMNKMFKLIEGCLPRSGAQAITLRYRNNYNTKEIARKMRVNKRTVHRYISIGLNKARQLLRAKGDNQNDCS